MKEFKTYHPVVNFVYFLLVIGFSMFFMHPLCLGISFTCAFAYSIVLKGSSVVKTNLAYMLPVIALTAVINPAFNHEGITILAYFPGGNPLTFESIAYGIAAAVMLVSVICWFSCCNEIMTSDKIIYLFGRVAPSLSLIISMTLRFLPHFRECLKDAENAAKCIGRGAEGGGIVKRAKCGLSVLSVTATRVLENAVETADSMKSRGYGLPGRTAFSIFKFDERDKKALTYLTALGIYILFGAFSGKLHFAYFPNFKSAEISAGAVCVFIAYLLLCIYPVALEILEAERWKRTKSKI